MQSANFIYWRLEDNLVEMKEEILDSAIIIFLKKSMETELYAILSKSKRNCD